MSNCSDIAVTQGCLANVAGLRTTIMVHYEYRTAANGNRTLHATRYTDAAGAPITLAVGETVSAGACPVISPDVEWLSLCDVSAAGVVTEFERRSITSFDSAGVASTVVADFASDRVTAYVPSGTVVACNQDCDPVAPVGIVTTWG